jgi:hypothetical protein
VGLVEVREKMTKGYQGKETGYGEMYISEKEARRNI